MPDTIIVALISLAGTAITVWAAVRAANNLVMYRLDKLEKKMDEHNKVQRRMLTAEINIRNLGVATGVEIMKGD